MPTRGTRTPACSGSTRSFRSSDSQSVRAGHPVERVGLCEDYGFLYIILLFLDCSDEIALCEITIRIVVQGVEQGR